MGLWLGKQLVERSAGPFAGRVVAVRLQRSRPDPIDAPPITPVVLAGSGQSRCHGAGHVPNRFPGHAGDPHKRNSVLDCRATDLLLERASPHYSPPATE